MTTETEKNGLYWTGGALKPLEERITYANPSALGASKNGIGDKVCDIVKSFIDSCQKQYVAFTMAMHGAAKFRDIVNFAIESGRTKPESTLSIGSTSPSSPQQPGKSIVAELSIGQIIKLSRPGGKFEDLHGKAFIVFVYNMWEYNFRRQPAKELSIQANQIRCDLMDDIRLIRNDIVHRDSVVSDDTIGNLKMLPEIWSAMAPGEELLITKDMILSLVEQINAIQIKIDNR